MKTSENVLICVVGPTAIGKTTLAIALAHYFETEIISADSRQFYKEMTIGTAVPTTEELNSVPHHFIHSISIHQLYTVGDFERDAIAKLSELFQSKKVVIMAGGSGLYVDAIVHGFDEFPEVDPKIRNALIRELEDPGIEKLQAELKRVDPESYNTLDIMNPHRLVRALEIFRASGTKLSELRKGKMTKRDFDTLYIGLTADRQVVYDRINRRVDNMIAAGLLKEAEALYPYKDLNALQTVGYRELFEWMEGTLSREKAIEEIKKNTRRFAKRQGTWFRKNQSIHWFDFQTDPRVISTFIKQEKGL